MDYGPLEPSNRLEYFLANGGGSGGSGGGDSATTVIDIFNWSGLEFEVVRNCDASTLITLTGCEALYEYLQTYYWHNDYEKPILRYRGMPATLDSSASDSLDFTCLDISYNAHYSVTNLYIKVFMARDYNDDVVELNYRILTEDVTS